MSPATVSKLFAHCLFIIAPPNQVAPCNELTSFVATLSRQHFGFVLGDHSCSERGNRVHQRPRSCSSAAHKAASGDARSQTTPDSGDRMVVGADIDERHRLETRQSEPAFLFLISFMTREYIPSCPKLQTFVINLDRSPDRMEAMRRRLGRVDLSWRRIPGVDGKTLDLALHADVDEAGYRRRHGKKMNPAEAGCYLSHLEALRQFLAGPCDWVLVLEDDADFPEDFQQLLQSLLASNEQWDIVKLSSFHSGTPIFTASLHHPYELAIPLSRHMNANCVLYNRNAARTLSKYLLPMSLPYDHALERAWLFGLKLRVVVPSPCPSDTGLTSTIGDRKQLKLYKFPLYRRLPAMLFRLQTEVARFGFGLMQLFHTTRGL
ncbi:glycosyltransferase family 25 protein [Variovorax sp. YR566]|uniref:glycosyltransferase family 25 protein n=1 Tax=Variovorax sp. YR566 TaxID=3450237 RepID=UPI003F80818E